MVVRRSVLQSAISIEAFYAIVRFQIKNPALVCTATFTESLSAELSDRTRSASNCYCGEAGLSHGTALFVLVRYFYLPPCLRSTKHYVLNISERPICTTERILHALLADHRRISSFLLRCYSTGIVFCSCCPNKTSRFVPYFRLRVLQLPTWNEMPVCGASLLASSLVVTVWDVRGHEFARVTSLLPESVRLYCSPAALCLLAFLAAFLLAVISPVFLSDLPAFFFGEYLSHLQCGYVFLVPSVWIALFLYSRLTAPMQGHATLTLSCGAFYPYCLWLLSLGSLKQEFAD